MIEIDTIGHWLFRSINIQYLTSTPSLSNLGTFNDIVDVS